MRSKPNTTLWPSFSRTYHPDFENSRLTFERASGTSLYDISGKKYFDAFSTHLSWVSPPTSGR